MPDENPAALDAALQELKLSRTWSPYAPLDNGQMLRLQARFGRGFSPTLKQLYAAAGGGEFSCSGGLVVFFDLEALLDAHRRLEPAMPGWIAFADDSQGNWFVLRMDDPKGAVHLVDSRGLEGSEARTVSASFPAFLRALTRGMLEL